MSACSVAGSAGGASTSAMLVKGREVSGPVTASSLFPLTTPTSSPVRHSPPIHQPRSPQNIYKKRSPI
jgi:hypothetical protein